MTKKMWMKSSILTLSVVLAACGGGTEETGSKAVKKETVQPVKSDETREVNSVIQDSVEKEGTYVGQIDNNSIEIESAGETLVLRLTDGVRDTVAELKENATVTVVYKENGNGQLMLEEITASDAGNGTPSETKTLEYTVNGTKVEKEATLTTSEQDYYFYKIDSFEFAAEEPQKDLLYVSENEETFVRIEPLSEDSSIDDLKKWANDELSAVGEVKEVSGSEVAGPAFESTQLFITASKDSFKKYIVIQELNTGEKVKFTINLPKHQKAAEWEQEIWAMLSTLKTK
jgi:hypothetical protein